MCAWLRRIPFALLIVLCLTLGLAPFVPEPHLWQKLKMLAAGELVEWLDIFDFLMHATPWLLLLVRLICLRGQTVADAADGRE